MILGPRPKLLLVEDNLDDIELIKIALNPLLITNELIIFQDGEEALSYLFDPHLKKLPDLILLDLYLPKMNGLEILKGIRENKRTKNLPSIIFTSSEEHSDMIKSYDLGANAYIKKGLDPVEFQQALKNLDVFWLLKEA